MLKMKTLFYKVATLWMLFRLYGNQITTTAGFKTQSEPIVSGTRAILGQFPWHVLLKRDPEDELLCGGSIIANEWVLTAAHCMFNRTSVFLVFGTIELIGSDVNMTSETFFIHPEFDMVDVINDIALIKLPTPLNFSQNIQAIELVSSSQASNDFVGVDAIISGFGRTQDAVAEPSDWLLWAKLVVVNNSVCDEIFAPLQDSELCTLGYNRTNMSPCEGDSGGALVWTNEANKMVQIGVFSFLEYEKCSQFPTGHARVTSYLDWIHNITNLYLD